jgi:plasmid stability protein
MKNVTITLDEDLVRWARIRAAERDTSISRLLRELLREKMAEEETYQTAMQQYVSAALRAEKPGNQVSQTPGTA